MAQVFETALTLPSTYLRALGHITHQWGTLEDIIGRLISVLSRLEKKEGRLIASQLSARPKVEVFRSLAKRKLAGHKARDTALTIANAAEEIIKRRNKFIHGTWGYPKGKKSQLHLIFVGGSSDNRLLPKCYRLRSKDMTSLGNHIYKCNKIALHLLASLQEEVTQRPN